MADEQRQEERTQKATPRRLQQAREHGQVPLSREVQSLAGLLAITLIAASATGTITWHFVNYLTILLRGLDHHFRSDPDVVRLVWLAFASGAGPFLAASLLAACVAGLWQTGFLVQVAALMPTAGRINPIAGFGRLLGTDNLIEAGKSLLKTAAMSAVCWVVLRHDLGGLLLVPQRGVAALLTDTMTAVTYVLLAALGVQALAAALDVAVVRFRHAQRLRMSHQDLRDEQRETEGDPRIKARIRHIRLQRARKRMMAAVPKATVVVTNPTHYAVALAYNRTNADAPRVVAKGVDSLAARIREIATAHHIPVVANPPVARALYCVELDHEIPVQHYQAVAEIIAYVWHLGRPVKDAH